MDFTQFRLTYEISPIILNGGIAGNISGGKMPIISLIQAQNFGGGILASSDADADINFNNFVAHFQPIPGSTLIENQVGMYPFANQQVAANAIVVQPLKLSMLMTAPAPAQQSGYAMKLAAFSSLQQQLMKHNLLGGTYTVATPAMYYTDMLLTALRDASSDESRQVQIRWQWDFIKPLLTLEDATQAYNDLTGLIGNRNPTPGDPPSYSGTANAVGSPNSGVAAPLIPAAQQLGGASTSVGHPSTSGNFIKPTPR